jgi:hypothetical protein
MRKILAPERRKIGNELHPLTTHFWDAIPLDKVEEVLFNHGLVLLQEDNTRFSGLLLGRESYTVFPLGDVATVDEKGIYTPIKSGLYFYWYRRDETGRYEINMYLT